jgi:predicted nucleic acid-binding protein
VRYLLDTCVISELVRPKPDARVTAWLKACDESDLALSVLTLGEIQKGAAKLPDAKRRRTIQRWLDHDLRTRFSGRILAIDDAVALVWGRAQGEAELHGESIPSIDGLIGATALAHNLTVVSHDDAIARTGARLLNPWAAE